MARYFSEKDIDGFRECFFLNAPSGFLRSPEQLTAVMRSLNFSPTKSETKKYFSSKGNPDKKLSFADFLDIMHLHSQREKVDEEILAAFRAGDKTQRGYISAGELRHILRNFGERLSQREIDSIFREANIQARGQVRYEDFVRLMLSPPPDY